MYYLNNIIKYLRSFLDFLKPPQCKYSVEGHEFYKRRKLKGKDWNETPYWIYQCKHCGHWFRNDINKRKKYEDIGRISLKGGCKKYEHI